MHTNQLHIDAKPTAFDELRFGYFDTAFGNILKAIGGGTNPIGVMTLAMCCVSALCEIEWAINNQQELEATGELKSMTRSQRQALGRVDKDMFEGWLNRWVRDSNVNPHCDAGKVYGVRCALIHTAGASETLCKTGVKAWLITTDGAAEHFTVVQNGVPRFSLDMPNFLAELMLATDRFLNDTKGALDNATGQLRLHIGFIAGLTRTDQSGTITGRLIRNVGSLAWFDNQLSVTPLHISRDALARTIRDSYNAVADRVLE
jgi:hypothetical protein